MKLPGTDTTAEEIEAIRLLESEKVLSADAEEKLAQLHEKVKLGVQFMQKLDEDKKRFNEWIGQELATGQGDMLPTLSRLKGTLNSPAAEFDAAVSDVEQLIADADKVLELVNDVSKKERRFSFSIKGRSAIKHWHSLDEAEKRQIRTNIVSLGVVQYLLSTSKSRMQNIGTLINLAMTSFNSAKQVATISKRALLQFIQDFIKELNGIRANLEALDKSLSAAGTFIARFKSYLGLEEKESEMGKAYAAYLLKVQSAIK